VVVADEVMMMAFLRVKPLMMFLLLLLPLTLSLLLLNVHVLGSVAT
jgi:hypothetical protein